MSQDAPEYKLPHEPNDPEYVAWETCDAEHAMENPCSTCVGRADRIRKVIAVGRAPLEKAGRMMLKAADELMTEFVSKKRAADWGVINEAMVAMTAALRAPGEKASK